MRNYIIMGRLPDFCEIGDAGFRIFQGRYVSDAIAANAARSAWCAEYGIDDPGDIWIMACTAGELIFTADNLTEIEA